MNAENNNRQSSSLTTNIPHSPLSLLVTGTLSGATTPDGLSVQTTAELIPLPPEGLDDLHLLSSRDNAHGNSISLVRLFAVENRDGEPFTPGWAVAASGRVKGDAFPERFHFEAGPFGFRLMQFVNLDASSYYHCDLFCCGDLQIGFEDCGDSLRISAHWNHDEAYSVAHFNGSQPTNYVPALLDADQPQAQGFMLMFVNAQNGRALAARFVQLPNSVMRTFHAVVERLIREPSNAESPFGTGIGVCAVDEDLMMRPQDCSVFSIWVVDHTADRLASAGALGTFAT